MFEVYSLSYTNPYLQRPHRCGRVSGRWLCLSANGHAPAWLAPVPELQSLGWDARFRQSKFSGLATPSILSHIQHWQRGFAPAQGFEHGRAAGFAVGLRMFRLVWNSLHRKALVLVAAYTYPCYPFPWLIVQRFSSFHFCLC